MESCTSGDQLRRVICGVMWCDMTREHCKLGDVSPDKDIALHGLGYSLLVQLGFSKVGRTPDLHWQRIWPFPFSVSKYQTSLWTKFSPVTYVRRFHVHLQQRITRLYMILFYPHGHCLSSSDDLTLALSPVAQSPTRPLSEALGTSPTACDGPESPGLHGDYPPARLQPSSPAPR